MRITLTSLALLAGAAAFAQNNVPPASLQPAVPYVQSAYDECLMTVGSKSWEVLGLNADQLARVNDLQARYKQGAKDAEAKALADEQAAAKHRKSGKKAAATTTLPEQANATPVEQPKPVELTPEATPQQTALDANGGLEKSDNATSIASTTDTPAPSASPYDDELRTILTPEQLKQWERRCDTRTGMVP